MPLSKEHLTPKLESLPKGLRLEAERIINKKFGRSSDKADKEFLDLADKLQQKAKQEYVNSLERMRLDRLRMTYGEPSYRAVVRNVQLTQDSHVALVDLQAGCCGRLMAIPVAEGGKLPDKQDCSCGKLLHIDVNEVIAAIRKCRLDQYRWRVTPPFMPGDLRF